MSRTRASAVFAAIVAMMAMVLGAVAFSPAAASASPSLRPYPPPPPALVVNRGWVKQYSTVRVTGRKYGKRERVYVTVSYKRPHHGRPFVRKTVVRTNYSGRFSLRLRMTKVGRAVIRATGSRSGKSASAVVIVRKRHGHGRPFQSAAAITVIDTGSRGLTTASATAPTDDRGLAVAGVGVLALLSGAVITSQVTRRRRKVHAG